MNNNPFSNLRIEFHILQSFPVTCLNRDDVGSPKTAIIGGSTRARVSSQCWKRQVRMEMQQLKAPIGIRTKLVGQLITEACLIEGADDSSAKNCGNFVEGVFIKDGGVKQKKNKKKKDDVEEAEDIQDETNDQANDTLVFLCPNEICCIAKAFKDVNFQPEALIKEKKDSKKQAKELSKLLEIKLEKFDALDIALFGRMVARAPTMNIEAAAAFAHALSTHKVNNEVEFFTALDDRQAEPGAAHLGSLEFNSATYYRYVSLDLGQLWTTLRGINLPEAVEVFTKSLFIAVPNARQSTMSGSPQWDFAKIFVRKGQRLQLSFEHAIYAQNGGFLQPSIERLEADLATKEKRAGSLFGKQAEFTFGKGDFSIDDLACSLKSYVAGAAK